MFVRFVTARQDENSHALEGVFQAAYKLRDAGKLAPFEEELLADLLKWYGTHLPSPACLSEIGTERAISWFKARAGKRLQKIWQIVTILKEHGVHVDMIRTDRPGTIIYEDVWQIAAIPPKTKRLTKS